MEREHINPWWNLWIHPKKTIQYLLDTNPKRVIIWLAIIGGMISVLSTMGILWMRYPQREDVHRAIFIIALLIAGGIFGILHLYFGGWLYTLTGSWIGGKGSFTQVKCAVGWSNWPFIFASTFSFISVLVVPNPWLQSLFGLLNLIAGVWGFVIFVNMLGQAHKFSAWKGVLAFLIALVLIFVALMIIALLVPLLSPLFQ